MDSDRNVSSSNQFYGKVYKIIYIETPNKTQMKPERRCLLSVQIQMCFSFIYSPACRLVLILLKVNTYGTTSRTKLLSD